MRFILVKTAGDEWLPFHKWRATHVAPTKTIDFFLCAITEADAKANVRARHPAATFSDEPPQMRLRFECEDCDGFNNVSETTWQQWQCPCCGSWHDHTEETRA